MKNIERSEMKEITPEILKGMVLNIKGGMDFYIKQLDVSEKSGVIQLSNGSIHTPRDAFYYGGLYAFSGLALYFQEKHGINIFELTSEDGYAKPEEFMDIAQGVYASGKKNKGLIPQQEEN